MKTTFAILAAVVMICGFAAPAMAVDFHYFWVSAWNNNFWPGTPIAVEELIFTANFYDEFDEEVGNADPWNDGEGSLYSDWMNDAAFGIHIGNGAEYWRMEYHWDGRDLIIPAVDAGLGDAQDFDLDFGNNAADPSDWTFDD